jgi:hypothetical protein
METGREVAISYTISEDVAISETSMAPDSSDQTHSLDSPTTR